MKIAVVLVVAKGLATLSLAALLLVAPTPDPGSTFEPSAPLDATQVYVEPLEDQPGWDAGTMGNRSCDLGCS